MKFYPTSFGQSITFTLPNVAAASYELRVRYKRDPDRGRATFWLDGAQIGVEIDQYASTSAFVEVTLGSITWGTAGSHGVRVVASSSSRTSRNLSVDSFILVPRSAQTTKTFESDVVPRTLSGGTASSYTEQAASGGRWLKFYPTAFGQSRSLVLKRSRPATFPCLPLSSTRSPAR